jgi:hypothetical protein
MGGYWSFEEDDLQLITTEEGQSYLDTGLGESFIEEEPKQKEVPKVLEETWFVLDSESNMDDTHDKAGGSLVKQFEEGLGIFPFKTFKEEDSRIFEARFEFPKYGEDFQYPEAIIEGVESPLGFIDFMTGFPLDNIEMLVMIGEYSTDPKTLAATKSVLPGEGGAAAPVPEAFFTWQEDMILMNYTALAQAGVEWMAKNLTGEPEPKSHWWLRYNLKSAESGAKYPVPGEFFGLGVRLMPDLPWGAQESSPFLYSGNWLPTIYYDSAVIKEIVDPTDDVSYPTYTVIWHGQEIKDVRPSDFCEYRVGDRATILKDVSTDKKTQLWKDLDQKEFGDNWMLAPICFYGLEKQDS